MVRVTTAHAMMKGEHASQDFLFEATYYEVQPVDTVDVEVLDRRINGDLVALANERLRRQLEVSMPGSPAQALFAQQGNDFWGNEIDEIFILRRILDRSVSRFFKSSYFKKSKLGKTAEKVEENVKTDMSFQDEKNVEHKFRFKAQLFRQFATISYSGFADARVIYDYRLERWSLSLDRRLTDTSTISISSALERGQSSQFVTISHWW